MTLAPETTDLRVRLRLTDGWFTACDLGTLFPGRGVAVLLPDGAQAALFRDRRGELYAIDNRDPFTGAAVLSRGLTGTHQGRPFVASPLLKQRFDLATGQCLDDESVRVTAYEVRATADVAG
ncbi:nitrite reductase small subunit NirD [Streptomyces griseoviridis]|jgi:nitrite reductase (NADH) small subunit|uniref:Nitrite reductase (NADH) small subunit n=3 Tax=Streptomyces TaxID=1883 RepID=A0ABT9LD36_STRGD|nr:MULTISPECIES: nitrite reductase small subunit NirD [Streptomyces]MDP9681644.1 nitrite reductase (NADH) small subunit [Streptomyces griseoviridis]GGS19467.1 nitrite reductase small subunit [Streptomyces niveoruber]GGS73097.1 nitrite reductase small subunit [Streptomyces griseoviridis]GGU43346.1 nitrite reductase small subunit [Streptomyces daghestanicus]GHI34359.1 nitrite reductase small subunit [Streptomyces daghestanicus]